MSKNLVHNRTSVVNIGYHLIWCPKYRRSVLDGDVDTRLKQILSEVAIQIGCSIDTMEVMPDHVHLFVRGSVQIPISYIVKRLKGASSRILRKEFPWLRRLPTLWTRSYYCETIGCISEATIKKYIQNQKLK